MSSISVWYPRQVWLDKRLKGICLHYFIIIIFFNVRIREREKFNLVASALLDVVTTDWATYWDVYINNSDHSGG